ncbi:hypothetical protein EP47_13615 [Legionella norrlandica]|uniref:Uncharacterized protein n=1 Tax=Legionella norrlandica TaxID=1498499 RepID=A0A0A2SN27_9GAMM|nr:hypothetical protein [Legionella norrlandica]KGP62152.1 hypothetical protein EP47_13615 [Legionella norrlandica]
MISNDETIKIIEQESTKIASALIKNGFFPNIVNETISVNQRLHAKLAQWKIEILNAVVWGIVNINTTIIIPPFTEIAANLIAEGMLLADTIVSAERHSQPI